MNCDIWALYKLMLKSRLFEEAIARLWHEGLISGEMHLGTGEEAIIAGVVDNLRAGDAMALDHRGTAALLMRGADPVQILSEVLGHPGGLSGGMGGHMHLFSKELIAASSGIVGACGPAAAGFGLSAQYLRPGAISVAFFGEGAMNQGMMMESINLSSAWKLPVLFVCKVDGWSITTRSEKVTGGNLIERVSGFGIPVLTVDGCDVSAVWKASYNAIENIRAGHGPTFIHATCVHLEGHFLGYQLLRIVRDPLKELSEIAVPLTKSLLHSDGALPGKRLAGLRSVLDSVLLTLRDPGRNSASDPVQKVRGTLMSEPLRLKELEDQIDQEISNTLASALEEVPL
jgi:TPP-dependent pyruvate/acetoin dehydrogenase alpha subunit